MGRTPPSFTAGRWTISTIKPATTSVSRFVTNLSLCEPTDRTRAETFGFCLLMVLLCTVQTDTYLMQGGGGSVFSIFFLRIATGTTLDHTSLGFRA